MTFIRLLYAQGGIENLVSWGWGKGVRGRGYDGRLTQTGYTKGCHYGGAILSSKWLMCPVVHRWHSSKWLLGPTANMWRKCRELVQ